MACNNYKIQFSQRKFPPQQYFVLSPSRYVRVQEGKLLAVAAV